MRTCLVTGGAGFVGSHLVEALVEGGWRVRVLDDLSTGRRAHVEGSAGVTLHVGDAADRAVVADAIAGCVRVYHLAALVGVARVMAARSTVSSAGRAGLPDT